tara:strand:- start:4296 stop:4544 length:249 start_codon:yes stop_codon:yes gene_type:complete
MSNVSDVVQPSTEFSVDIRDPWTIAAISLLSILALVASYRLYYTVCKRRTKVSSNKTVEVSRIKVEEKKPKTNFQTRAQMRG